MFATIVIAVLQLSPFHGQATSAGPARKVETGLNFTS